MSGSARTALRRAHYLADLGRAGRRTWWTGCSVRRAQPVAGCESAVPADSTGWVYAAFAIDGYPRMVVGPQQAQHLRTDLSMRWRRRHGAVSCSRPTCPGWCTTPIAAVQQLAIRYTEPGATHAVPPRP